MCWKRLWIPIGWLGLGALVGSATAQAPVSPSIPSPSPTQTLPDALPSEPAGSEAAQPSFWPSVASDELQPRPDLPPLPPGTPSRLRQFPPPLPMGTRSGPPPRAHEHAQGHGGPIKRAIHHAGWLVKDRMIGEARRFQVPPRGFPVYQNFAANARAADLHEFTLYRSDFFAGTERLTPRGTQRLQRMARRWRKWNGPLLIEVDPWRPGLAETRRDTLASLLAESGAPISPDRLAIAGSPYFGERGALAEGYNAEFIGRSIEASGELPLPPFPVVEFEN